MKNVKGTLFAATAFAASLALTLILGGRTALPPIGILRGDLLHSYESVEDLTNSADVVLVGKVIGAQQMTFGRLPFTLETLEVGRVLRGTNETSTIRILETGGLLPPGIVKGGNPALSRPTLMTFEAVPLMTGGEEYLVFLRRYVGPMTTDAFVVLSGYQGKFHVSDRKIRFEGDQSLLDDRSFSVQREFNGRSVHDLEAHVANAK